MKPFKPESGDLAGIDLIGRRTEDGSLRLGVLGQGKSLPDWPKEIDVLGTIFTLEEVKIVEKPNDANLEWGIYV